MQSKSKKVKCQLQQKIGCEKKWVISAGCEEIQYKTSDGGWSEGCGAAAAGSAAVTGSIGEHAQEKRSRVGGKWIGMYTRYGSLLVRRRSCRRWKITPLLLPRSEHLLYIPGLSTSTFLHRIQQVHEFSVCFFAQTSFLKSWDAFSIRTIDWQIQSLVQTWFLFQLLIFSKKKKKNVKLN